jgi:pimeloyl-ACP methyl ester carboxylesterase
MKEQILHTNKGNVFYWESETWDAGKDTLFFLHGLTADHSMFEGQLSAFAADYNLLTWDAPAHGRSRPFADFDFGDTSVYIGEKDRTGKVAQYNKAWARQTGYPLKIIKGAAHNANVDRPDEVNACISRFLSETI